MKAPAEFSPRTNLIENLLPNILDEGRCDIDSEVEQVVAQLETLLSTTCNQHNLDKYQRQLIRREDQKKMGVKRGMDGRLINPPKQKVLSQHLPELERAFLDGIQAHSRKIHFICTSRSGFEKSISFYAFWLFIVSF